MHVGWLGYGTGIQMQFCLPAHTSSSIYQSMNNSVSCPQTNPSYHPWKKKILIHGKCYLSTHYPSYHPWKVLPVDIPFIQPCIYPSIHPSWMVLWWVLLVLAREATKEGRQTTKVSSVVCSILIWLLCFQLSDRLLMPIWTFRRGARILCV